MKNIKAFLLGMYEFRQSYTTNVGDDAEIYYDWGRDFAHSLTFRRYEA